MAIIPAPEEGVGRRERKPFPFKELWINHCTNKSKCDSPREDYYNALCTDRPLEKERERALAFAPALELLALGGSPVRLAVGPHIAHGVTYGSGTLGDRLDPHQMPMSIEWMDNQGGRTANSNVMSGYIEQIKNRTWQLINLRNVPCFVTYLN